MISTGITTPLTVHRTAETGRSITSETVLSPLSPSHMACACPMGGLDEEGVFYSKGDALFSCSHINSRLRGLGAAESNDGVRRKHAAATSNPR